MDPGHFSRIVPVFKSDDETDPNNYKPISLLSNFNILTH